MANFLEQQGKHTHDFVSHNHQGEKGALYVLILTVAMMIVEISAGTIYGSMALLADGWHMGTHAAAFCITLFTYRYARKYADTGRFSFGAGKVSVLGGYTSAIALGIVAIIMFLESIHRLFSPLSIQFNESIVVAIIGLVVNVASMFLLQDHHHHDHHHHDHNLKAAYMHVLADALTSLLAIVALIVGKYLGLTWLDPIMGIVGALVITKWAIGLMQQTSPILLDESILLDYKKQVISELESDGTEVSDIHIWKISADHYSAVISLVSNEPQSVDSYKHQLLKFDKIHHLTIEINHGNDNGRTKSIKSTAH